MAKTSWLERNKRKQATVKKFAAKRAELKARKDYAGLSKLPRNASPVRVVNRCAVSGRRHGFRSRRGEPSGSYLPATGCTPSRASARQPETQTARQSVRAAIQSCAPRR